MSILQFFLWGTFSLNLHTVWYYCERDRHLTAASVQNLSQLAITYDAHLHGFQRPDRFAMSFTLLLLLLMYDLASSMTKKRSGKPPKVL